MKLISDDKKYFKHIRTYIDEIVCLYYTIYKESDIQEELDLDYCQFSSTVYNLYDKSNTIEEFIINVLNSISIMKGESKCIKERSIKALLKRINELEKYHKRYSELYKVQFV